MAKRYTQSILCQSKLERSHLLAWLRKENCKYENDPESLTVLILELTELKAAKLRGFLDGIRAIK